MTTTISFKADQNRPTPKVAAEKCRDVFLALRQKDDVDFKFTLVAARARSIATLRRHFYAMSRRIDRDLLGSNYHHKTEQRSLTAAFPGLSRGDRMYGFIKFRCDQIVSLAVAQSLLSKCWTEAAGGGMCQVEQIGIVPMPKDSELDATQGGAVMLLSSDDW